MSPTGLSEFSRRPSAVFSTEASSRPTSGDGAVVGRIELVVTNNLRHFAVDDLAPLGKRSLDADAFLGELLDCSPHIVRAALDQQVGHMRQPRPWTLAEFLGRLAGQGSGDPLAPRFAAACERRFSLVPKMTRMRVD